MLFLKDHYFVCVTGYVDILQCSKNIIFQILYIIVVPLYAPPLSNRSFSTKPLLLTSTVCSDWLADPVHCDWPNTSSMRWKCNAPYYNHELQL